MKRRLVAAGLVLAAPACAFAQDEKILSGNAKDDIEFADHLVEKGYADLADKLLQLVEKKGGGGAEAAAAIKKVRLNAAQEAALKEENLVKRKDNLVKVLEEKLKFVDEAKNTVAGQSIHDTLPDLYDLIGQTLNSAIKKEKDPAVISALRSQGNGLYEKAEAALLARVEELRKVEEPRPEDVEYAYQAGWYNYARTLMFHAQLFEAGSGRRTELLNQAIHEYEEFDLTFSDSIFNYYGFIDVGNCLKDLGKTADAISSFDTVINLRAQWEQDKNGVYLIPGDIASLVCYATVQKMLLLKETKKLGEVVAVGKDYFAAVLEPWEPPQSAAVADMLGDALVDTGDLKGASELAATMKQLDPNGPLGYLGGQLLERTGGGSYTDRLKSAQVKLEQNEPDAAIAIARLVLAETSGTPDETEAGCDAWLTIGTAYQRRGWVEEAALAYQTGADRYPKAKGTVDALFRAIDCYQSAQRLGKRKLYRDRVEENSLTLTRNFSNDPRVGDIIMLKAKGLESEGDYLGAIELYKTVATTSVNYTKALLLTGIDYFNHAQNLAGDPKTAAEAKAFYPQAEAAFRKTSDEIGKRRGTTLDKAILGAYDTQEYFALMSLAKLYMIPAFGKTGEAPAVVAQLESNAAWSKDHGPEIQNLRGSIYLSQGKFEEAEKWVDELAKRDPVAAAGPAGRLARELDAQGDAKRKEKPNSSEGDELWKRAARFYYMSVKPMVDGVMSQDADTMVEVGRRMMVYALHFNGVPAERQNFVDWTPSGKNAPEYFRRAAEIFRAGLEQNPDYRNSINLGRCYGFLKQWVQAADVYAKLFEQEPVVNPKDKRRLDPVVTKAKPELVPAYLEWGVAERMACAEDQNKDRLLRCLNVIFAPLSATLKPDSYPEAYWGTTYHLAMTYYDRGDYNEALLVIEDRQRQVSPTYDDDKFGYKSRFIPLEEDLRTKLRRPK